MNWEDVKEPVMVRRRDRNSVKACLSFLPNWFLSSLISSKYRVAYSICIIPSTFRQLRRYSGFMHCFLCCTLLFMTNKQYILGDK